ncbi:S-DNA-T family DNA segregation ATPase FtsK/SpoIIIE [Pseudorhizobium tarimense]|uniref:S-DNA-T family DNA segregation ATPase FtsK/SpoIIIE n=1 Tax=Pseudorhizobium tarimense TaxID=1079109 RepID=A0ABV2HE85_9HYPH|nr:DNA translocase FtsK [Pseudorhizobium tarimense]MCJ8521830.1 DNA translocase FtsK [Pseudorhizobium tarimense]
MQEPSRTSFSPATADEIQQTEAATSPSTSPQTPRPAGPSLGPREGSADAIVLDPERLPSWQRPFVLGPNVRFTRTPSRSSSPSRTLPTQSVKDVEPMSSADVSNITDAGSPARCLQQRLELSLDRAENDVVPQSSSAPDAPASPRFAVVHALGANNPDATHHRKDRPVPPEGNARRADAGLFVPDHLLWEMLSLGAADLQDCAQELWCDDSLFGSNEAPLEGQSCVTDEPAPKRYLSALQKDPADDTPEPEDFSLVRLYRQVEIRRMPPVTVQPEAVSSCESVERTPHTTKHSINKPAVAHTVDAQPTYEQCHGAADYLFPSVELLQPVDLRHSSEMSHEALEKSAGLLESVLEDFGIKGDIIDVRPGPVVTLYEFAPAPGVKSSRIINLSDDIARSMSALSARVAVVPGRNVIGIELPNPERETVFLRELFESQDYLTTDYRLPLCLGKTIGGEPVVAELAKMPHLLVAGTTGSGKSVAINTMILSLIYHLRPDECRLIMVDPKMLELSVYDGIPHLLTPVVTDSKKAVLALKWAVREMEERYRKMSRLGVRNIDGFNKRVAEARRKGETILVSAPCGFDPKTGQELFEQQELDLSALPYIVIIVDEMADLMMVAGKEIEGAIQRLAQMARAAGIHLIMATQRPSVDVITGTIKANFPTRISFQVTSKIDSRTILGEQGAEHLLGQGDMLHMVGGGRIARVHGPFVSDREVEKVVAHLKSQGQPSYLGGVTEDTEPASNEDGDAAVFDQSEMCDEAASDDLYARAVKVVQRDSKCSTSYIQRRLSIGYNRAASLVERMEREGLVGPPNHVGKREILNGGIRSEGEA